MTSGSSMQNFFGCYNILSGLSDGACMVLLVKSNIFCDEIKIHTKIQSSISEENIMNLCSTCIGVIQISNSTSAGISDEVISE